MYEESKKELVRICHLLYDKNLVTAADGNVSVRVSKDHILLTPSGKGKGFVEEKDILVLDLDGNLGEGSGMPSREYFPLGAAHAAVLQNFLQAKPACRRAAAP